MNVRNSTPFPPFQGLEWNFTHPMIKVVRSERKCLQNGLEILLAAPTYEPVSEDLSHNFVTLEIRTAQTEKSSNGNLATPVSNIGPLAFQYNCLFETMATMRAIGK
jgi:hypothetical protein